MHSHLDPTLVDRLNALLDGIPRRELVLGTRGLLPTYRVLGVAGALLGILVALLLAALLPGRSLLAMVGLAPTSAAVFLLFGWVRRLLTKREGFVLQEQLLAVLGVGAFLLVLVGLPALAHLDVMLIGLAVTTSIGRLGCFLGGCCYGVPSDVGVVYPAECHGPGTHPRRLPVQLFASAAWALLAIVGVLAAVLAPAGAALALVLVLYGIVRPVLETLRDDTRPRLGLTSGVWMSLLGLAVGLVVWVAAVGAIQAELVLAGAGVLVALILAATTRFWLERPAAHRLPDDAATTVDALCHEAGDSVRIAVCGPARFGTARVAGGVELSVSGLEGPVSRAQARQWLRQALGREVPEAALALTPGGVVVVLLPDVLSAHLPPTSVRTPDPPEPSLRLVHDPAAAHARPGTDPSYLEPVS